MQLLQLIEDAAASAEKQKREEKKKAGSAAAAGAARVGFYTPTPSSPLLEAASPAGVRTVTMLRPRPGLLLDGSQSVTAAAQKMQDSNTDAALIVDVSGQLTGIITDTDVTRRVLANHLDPNRVRVVDVMTEQPACVSEEGTAFEALSLMVEGRFRHLPVIGTRPPANQPTAVGVLDVAKCLFDAINNIEASKLPGGDTLLSELLRTARTSGGHARSRQNCTKVFMCISCHIRSLGNSSLRHWIP